MYGKVMVRVAFSVLVMVTLGITLLKTITITFKIMKIEDRLIHNLYEEFGRRGMSVSSVI